MTLAQLEKRVTALEEAVKKLREKVGQNSGPNPRWWAEGAGRFANDPLFDEMVRLGKEYRDSLHPDLRKKHRKKRKIKSRS